VTAKQAYKTCGALTDVQAAALCRRLRGRILQVVSRTGGHLASNLGVVELTVALHRVFDTGRDRLVFDVGHQCYCHKILTGRDSEMETLRTFEGLSGYPKPCESVHDAFVAGHASNAVSVALGMARARTLKREHYHVVALLGDGALTGGLAYEGLSDAGNSGESLMVILNDNGMSITESVGGVAQHLAHQRLKPQYLSFKKGYRRVMGTIPGGKALYRVTHKVKTAIKETLLPCSLFEDMGFTYLGPVDGHDVAGLTKLLRYAKDLQGPVLLHVRTVKGKGYRPAEKNPDAFHGVGRFVISTGETVSKPGENFSSTFGKAMVKLAAEDDRLCAITAAMVDGTGLVPFAQTYPRRFFDVGIAEGHATTMAAGMAKQGLRPVFAVYATFLQRAYDMLLHDVALQKLPVVFAVDRAGLVGEDGETHQGLYDVPFLTTVPHMSLYAPASFAEVEPMLRRALAGNGPAALRYPRGGERGFTEDVSGPNTVCLREGQGLTLVTYGPLTGGVLEVAERLCQDGLDPAVYKLNRVWPLDWEEIGASAALTGRLLVAEECSALGCVGEKLLSRLLQKGIPLKAARLCNAGDAFIPQGTQDQQRKLVGLDAESLYQAAREVAGHG